MQCSCQLSADVIATRGSAAADASQAAARHEKLRLQQTMRNDRSDADDLPEGCYVDALLAAMPASPTKADSTGRKRSKRKADLLERVALHAKYLQPALTCEFAEEWHECEKRLDRDPDALQV